MCGTRKGKTNLQKLRSAKNIKHYHDVDPNRKEAFQLHPKPKTEKFCSTCRTRYLLPLGRASRKEVIAKIISDIEKICYTFPMHSEMVID